jgi:sacsin
MDAGADGSSSDVNWFGDDFGQKIDLTVRIREILRNYPEGISILKELIQNADDAGAHTINFCLDTRTHSSNTLWGKGEMGPFQGPGMCACETRFYFPASHL